jgi:hypothetical protein
MADLQPHLAVTQIVLVEFAHKNRQINSLRKNFAICLEESQLLGRMKSVQSE